MPGARHKNTSIESRNVFMTIWAISILFSMHGGQHSTVVGILPGKVAQVQITSQEVFIRKFLVVAVLIDMTLLTQWTVKSLIMLIEPTQQVLGSGKLVLEKSYLKAIFKVFFEFCSRPLYIVRFSNVQNTQKPLLYLLALRNKDGLKPSTCSRLHECKKIPAWLHFCCSAETLSASASASVRKK